MRDTASGREQTGRQCSDHIGRRAADDNGVIITPRWRMRRAGAVSKKQLGQG